MPRPKRVSRKQPTPSRTKLGLLNQFASEEHYRKLTENALIGICIIQDGRFAYVNQRLAELLGAANPDELIGQELPAVDEDRAKIAEYIRQREAGERESAHYQLRARRKDGQIVTLEVLGWRIELGGRPAIQGIAIDISQRQEIKRLRQRLLEIGQQILQSRDITVILRAVTQAIYDHSPFKLVALSLFERAIDPARGEVGRIAQVVTAGLTPAEEAELQRVTAAKGLILCQQIIQKGNRLGGGYYITPGLIPGIVPRGIRGRRGSRRPGEWGPYDNLYFMLKQGDRVIGRLSLADPAHGQVPREEDLEPLEILTNLAALAIIRAQRDQEVGDYQKRLRGVFRIAQQLAQINDMEQICHQTLQTIQQEFKYEYGAILLQEAGALVLRAVASSFSDIRFREGVRFAIGERAQGVVGWVATTGAPALVNDVHRDPHYLEGHPKVNSELAVPIKLGEDLLGVLNLESRELNAFDEEDLELLSALADQLAIAISQIRHRQQLGVALDQREHINRFLRALNQTEDLQEMLVLVIQQGMELLAPKADAGSFLLWNETKAVFEFVAAINRDLERLAKAPLTREHLLQAVLAARKPVIYTRDTQLRQPALKELGERMSLPPPASTISLPIRQKGELVALFNINNLHQEGVFSEADAQQLWALVPEIELALSRAQDHERLRRLSIHDPLTGLYNRHYLSEVLEREIARAKRYGHPISLLIIDLDDFNRVNNTMGHLVGDRVLAGIAQLIKDELREVDFVFRFGGDEFLVLLPETDGKAQRLALRLHETFARWNQASGLGFPLSFSLGLSSWQPAEGRSFDEALAEADKKMYTHKDIHQSKGRKR